MVYLKAKEPIISDIFCYCNYLYLLLHVNFSGPEVMFVCEQKNGKINMLHSQRVSV